jgi:hypothetical protein
MIAWIDPSMSPASPPSSVIRGAFRGELSPSRPLRPPEVGWQHRLMLLVSVQFG